MEQLPEPDRGAERACAWFADERDGVLYFGISSFWSALRTRGDALADLAVSEPRRIGRFDLAAEALLPPIAAGASVAPSGVWDVLAHPNGRVYFTTFFDAAGSVGAGGNDLRLDPQAGVGLNELALGPDGRILATRYGYGDDARGAVVVLSPEGAVEAEHVLAAGDRRVAAKSVAFDPARREIWVNTDLFDAHGAMVGHDARVLGWDGAERRRWSEPEVQFMAFDAAGRGAVAERDGGGLWLRLLAPEREPDPRTAGDRVLLDAAPPASDFAQELRIAADGAVLVTRWSGELHLVRGDGRVQRQTLPRPGGRGLYYSGFLRAGRVCATRCDGIEVVCADAPP